MTKLAESTEAGQRTIQAVGPGAAQSCSPTSASDPIANNVGKLCTVVFLTCDQDCHIAFGAAPVATTGDFFLPAATTIAFRIDPGTKVAAIRASADGTLWVSEGSN